MHIKLARSSAHVIVATFLSIGVQSPMLAQDGMPADAAPTQLFQSGGRNLTPEQAKALDLSHQALAPIAEGQWAAARMILLESLHHDPNCIPALLNAGMCSNQLGQFDEGRDYSSRVIKLAPERYEAWVNLGSSYQGAGRLDDAVKTYKEYLNRFPSESHRAQIEALVKGLSHEIDRQNAVVNGDRHDKHHAANSSPPAAQSTDDDDYFAYSVPDSIMKWTTLPVKVYVPSDAEASKVPGYIPDFGQMLRAAFSEWADKSNGSIVYKFVPTASGADIECRWVGDSSQVRTPAEGGDADILTSVGQGIKHVNITILTNQKRAGKALTSPNTIFATALHEVGHSLGITGHSPNPNDIMYSSVPEAIAVRHLTDRDTKTLAHLYRDDVKVGGAFTTASTGDLKVDLCNQGAALMSAGDFNGAEKKLEAALRISPEFKLARINLAVCLTNNANQIGQLGKYHEAIAHYKRALELLNDDSDMRRKGLIMKNCAAMLYNANRGTEAQAMDATANRLLQQPGQ